MYGAILGDIIGSPYEFDRGEKTRDFRFFCDRSQFTDDTVMTIAVGEALMDSRGKNEATHKAALVASMQKWGRMFPDAGYGGMFYRWLVSENPQPYGSYGNGSAMRVSAAGWLYDTLGETREKARWTAEVTHNHPEGIKGAEAVASAIYLARTGRDKEEIRKYIVSQFGYDLSRTCDEIRPGYRHVETCQETVPEAMTAFLEGETFSDVIRNAVSLGGDCDTLTCIAGSMGEAMWHITSPLVRELLKRIPPEMEAVLVRFNWMRIEVHEDWMRAVARGEISSGDRILPYQARGLVYIWNQKGRILRELKKGYETGDFSGMEKYLTYESVFDTPWFPEPLEGKEKIMKYLTAKGKKLVRENTLAQAEFPKGLFGQKLRVRRGDKVVDILIQLDSDGNAKRVDLVRM